MQKNTDATNDLRSQIDALESEDCTDREAMAALQARMNARLDTLDDLYRRYFALVSDLSELASMTSNDMAWHRLSAIGHECAPAITRISAPGGSRLAAAVTVTAPLNEPDAAAVVAFLARLSRAFGSRPIRVIASNGVYTVDSSGSNATDRTGADTSLVDALSVRNRIAA